MTLFLVGVQRESQVGGAAVRAANVAIGESAQRVPCHPVFVAVAVYAARLRGGAAAKRDAHRAPDAGIRSLPVAGAALDRASTQDDLLPLRCFLAERCRPEHFRRVLGRQPALEERPPSARECSRCSCLSIRSGYSHF